MAADPQQITLRLKIIPDVDTQRYYENEDRLVCPETVIPDNTSHAIAYNINELAADPQQILLNALRLEIIPDVDTQRHYENEDRLVCPETVIPENTTYTIP